MKWIVCANEQLSVTLSGRTGAKLVCMWLNGVRPPFHGVITQGTTSVVYKDKAPGPNERLTVEWEDGGKRLEVISKGTLVDGGTIEPDGFRQYGTKPC